jgi:hypothetical protein
MAYEPRKIFSIFLPFASSSKYRTGCDTQD